MTYDDEAGQLTDIELSQVIKEITGTAAPMIAKLKRKERNEALRQITELRGVSYKQISRVTGMTLNMIYRSEEKQGN